MKFKITLFALSLFSISSNLYAQAGLCPADCTGQKPISAFDFIKKLQQSGDPNTGGTVGSTIQVPGDIDNETPNTSVDTKSYFDQLQSFEEWSAKECGESVNDPDNSDVVVAKSCATDLIKQRWKVIGNLVHKKKGIPTPSQEIADKFFKLAISKEQKELQKKSIWYRQDGVETRYRKCSKNGFEVGEKAILSVYAEGKFCTDMSAPKIPTNQPFYIGIVPKTYTRVDGEGKLGVYVFNKDLNILRTTADYYSGQNDVARQTTVYYMGSSIHSEAFTAKEIGPEHDLDVPIGSVHESASASYPVGPILLTVEAGAIGTAGVRFVSRQTGLWANGSATPYLDTKVYAEGSVNAWIAKAGVAANLAPFLRDSLSLYGFSAIAAVPTPNSNTASFIFSQQLNGSNKVDALYGNIEAFVKIRRPKFFGWKWKKYAWQLFSWDGYSDQGYFFSEAVNAAPIAQLQNVNNESAD